jgi:integrase
MKLDADTIRTLKLPPDKNDVIFFDDSLIGFGIRLRSDGGSLRRTWIAQYRAKRRTRRIKIGDVGDVDKLAKRDVDRVRDKAFVALGSAKDGQDPQSKKEEARKLAARTLKSVAEEYLAMKQFEMEAGKYRPASYRVTKLYLTGKVYFGPLQTTTITEISLADIAARLNAITRNNGTVTSGRARSALSSMFTWAMQQGLMGDRPNNPVTATRKPEDATPRDRVLKDTELAAIWRGCKDDDFGKIVKLLTLTACRREEIGGLRWTEIDLDNCTLTLPKERVKNKHEHKLPLTPLALSIIDMVHERVDRDHLFGDRSDLGFTKWSTGKNELDVRLGDDVRGWRLHDLRRSVATWMAEHGDIEPHFIEAVLNHYSGHRSGVAGIYNRAKYGRQMRTALTLWADHLRAIVDAGERKIVPFHKEVRETA